MCTCVALNFDRFYFGRNMDLEGSFGECVVTAPRNFTLEYRTVSAMVRHYAMIGMAAVVSNYPLFADAMNEKGLCMAGLNFPGNAVYADEPRSGKRAVTPFEMIPWVLGQCATAKEAKQLLWETEIVAIPFSEQLPLTPLHWFVADKKMALSIEPMADGLRVYDNPIGVLANNPPFPFHMANLARYANLSSGEVQNEWTKDESSVSFGLGGVGLPGDYSSPSRFVRTAFLKKNLTAGSGAEEQIDSVFRILDAVAPPKGCVLSPDGRPHYTTYSCCMDVTAGRYYCKRYGSLATSCFTLDVPNGDALVF